MTFRSVQLDVMGRQLECKTALTDQELNEVVARVNQTKEAMDDKARVLWEDAKSVSDHGVNSILGALNLAYLLIRQEQETHKLRNDLEQKLFTLLADVPDVLPPSQGGPS